jgi:chromosome segregation ATPase
VSRDAVEMRKKLAETEEKLRKSDARVTKLLAQQKTQLKSLPRTVVADGDKDSMIASLQEKVADLELELENAEYCESTNHAETFMPMINDLQMQLTAARKENERVREQLETARADSRQASSQTNNDDDEEDYKVPDLAQSEAIRYSNHVNEEELTARNFELEAQVNALEQQVESLTSKLELQSLEHETAIAKQTILHKEELEKTELALHARESEMSKLNLELESVQSRMSQLDKDLRRQQTQSLDLKMTLETKAMENDELRRSLIRVAEDTPELDKAVNRRSIVMASPAMEGSKWQVE